MVALSFDTLQPFFWATVHYGIVLPSAAVAWSLPEAPPDDELEATAAAVREGSARTV